MSSFIGTGLTCGFNLDLIKTASCPPLGCHSSSSSTSSISSTISKCSDSSFSISTKRARTPRKRPSQSYNEAAALLSTIYPNLFSSKNLHKKYSKQLSPISSSTSSSIVIPPFPVVDESDFLIENQSTSPKSPPRFKFKHASASPIEKSCIGVQKSSPPRLPDCIVESIVGEEVEEGIDSIMGKLSMDDCDYNISSGSYVNPFVGSLMGFGFGLSENGVRKALRGVHNDEGERPLMVQMSDIVPEMNPPLEKKMITNKKNKKKMEKEVKNEVKVKKMSGTTHTTGKGKLEGGLGLKLNPEKVLRAWTGRRFPFFCESGTSESSADIAARLAKIDLSLGTKDEGVREISFPKHKKRRTPHSSKKILCQIRKVNADCQPRMKGRFVKRAQLHKAIKEGSQ